MRLLRGRIGENRPPNKPTYCCFGWFSEVACRNKRDKKHRKTPTNPKMNPILRKELIRPVWNKQLVSWLRHFGSAKKNVAHGLMEKILDRLRQMKP